MVAGVLEGLFVVGHDARFFGQPELLGLLLAGQALLYETTTHTAPSARMRAPPAGTARTTRRTLEQLGRDGLQQADGHLAALAVHDALYGHAERWADDEARASQETKRCNWHRTKTMSCSSISPTTKTVAPLENEKPSLL